MFDRLRRYSNRIPYHGAGVLFACRTAGPWEVLLFRRAIDPDRGFWSVAGGECNPGESYRAAAAREASEEVLGDRALVEALGAYLIEGFTMDTAPEQVQYRIPLVFGWRNYLVELREKPPEGVFRLNWENDAMGWFPAVKLPDTVHAGVRKAIAVFGLR